MGASKNMVGFEGEKELIFRMDERLGLITSEIMHMKTFLETKVMTKDMCNLAQAQHDKGRVLDRVESMSKAFAVLSVAAGIIWVMLNKS